MTETIAPGGPTALAELPDPPRIGYDQLFKRLLHPERERVDMLAGLQDGMGGAVGPGKAQAAKARSKGKKKRKQARKDRKKGRRK